MKNEKIWWENPKILIDPNSILEIFPKQEMTYNQKINAFTRLVIIFISLYVILTGNYKLLILVVFIFIVIYIYFSNDITHSNKDIKINKINNYTSDKSKETYKRSIKDVSKPESKKISYKYVKPSDNNPFMNRLPFEKKTNLDKITILKKNSNSFKNTQNKINDKFTDGLYKDITDIYGNENSQRQFYTVSNTDIVSEQGKFAEWLYSN